MRRVLIAALAGLVTCLSAVACAGSPAAAPASGPAGIQVNRAASASASGAASADPASAAGGTSADPASPSGAFTVAGDNPVPVNGSQDTYAQAGGVSCDSATFALDRRLGGHIADGFSVTGLPASADLLRHFLAGAGTVVSYPAGSRISRLAAASAGFVTVNEQVQAEVTRQLKAGTTQVRLPAAQLATVSFASAGGDLYWGFRGTQGLSVSGSGHLADGAYTGTLTYVIRDSYGFPEGDTLAGFGAPMRYLQTVCGAPQHAGGARWFPDSITVTVPFRAAG
jgi:hypothetical protein